MDFKILYAIQGLRTPFLDGLFVGLTGLVGNYNELWLVTAAILIYFKQTRKWGFTMLASFVMVALIGQVGLKLLVVRPRPCQLDDSVALLVKRPTSSSFPSTHAAFACAGAMSVYQFDRKWGRGTFLIAVLLAFSRMYLFLHFPTDVLAGAVLGVLCGALAADRVKWAYARDEELQRERDAIANAISVAGDVVGAEEIDYDSFAEFDYGESAAAIEDSGYIYANEFDNTADVDLGQNTMDSFGYSTGSEFDYSAANGAYDYGFDESGFNQTDPETGCSGDSYGGDSYGGDFEGDAELFI